jgi:hypothetical protein
MDLETHDVMASALVERGLIAPADAAADRAALEVELSGGAPAQHDPTLAAQPPPPNPDADPLEAAVWAAPPSAKAYDLSQGVPAPEGAEHSHEFEAANRAALYAAGIPQSIGNHLAKRWNDVMASGELPNDTQLEMGKRQALADLTKQWGADTKANLALAKSVVDTMEEHQPAIWQMLETSGLGNDPWLITTLANLARARGPAA